MVISGLGSDMIGGTEPKKRTAPHLGLNQPSWNQTDLQEIQIEIVIEPVRFGFRKLGCTGKAFVC